MKQVTLESSVTGSILFLLVLKTMEMSESETAAPRSSHMFVS